MKLEQITKALQGFETSGFTLDLLSKLSNLGQTNPKLYAAISSCVLNGTQMNTYLFTLPVENRTPVVWLGKTSGKFVWMTGYVNQDTAAVRELIENNLDRIQTNPLTTCPQLPPYLLYVDVFAQSQWQQKANSSTNGKVSDFSIFQVEVNDEEIQDIEQQMVMSADFLTGSVTTTFRVVSQYCDIQTRRDFQKLVLPKASLLSKLHTELHNIGHFMGAFPYTKPEKDSDNYEAIEEYKACLSAVVALAQMEISAEIQTAFALLVVCTRIFNYGYRSHYTADKTVQIIREITVGVLFFELLKRHEVLHLNSAGKVVIYPERILEAVTQELTDLYTDELQARQCPEYLNAVAIEHYKRAYPRRRLSKELSLIYSWQKLKNR